MYIATFGRSLVVLMTINTNLAGANMDVGSEAMHTGMYALLRQRTLSVTVLKSLEQLASNNGVDVHKYKILHIKNIVHTLTLFLYKMS